MGKCFGQDYASTGLQSSEVFNSSAHTLEQRITTFQFSEH